ncbi:hypothetical protein VDGL01_04514 [Verticillium dahliae]
MLAGLLSHNVKQKRLVGLVVKRITSNDEITGSIPVRGILLSHVRVCCSLAWPRWLSGKAHH